MSVPPLIALCSRERVGKQSGVSSTDSIILFEILCVLDNYLRGPSEFFRAKTEEDPRGTRDRPS